MAGPPELDGAPEGSIEEEATQLLQRVVLVSGDDVPDVEIIEVVTEVEEWLANNSTEDDEVSINTFAYSQSRSPLLGAPWPWAMLAECPPSLDPSCSVL